MSATHTPGLYSPESPPPLRRPGESLEDYRARCGWDKPPAAHTPMVVAAARALCKRESEFWGVDEQGNWNAYADGWLADAKAVLDAVGAPELLGALRELVALEADGMQSSESAIEVWERARAAISKATGGAQ